MSRKRKRETSEFVPFKKQRKMIRTRRTIPMPLAVTSYFRKPTGELKFFDIAQTVYQANTTAVFTLLAIPVLGTDYNTRIGRKINLKSYYIRGYVNTEAAAAAGAIVTAVNQARIIIFIDYQPNGAAPTAAALLTASTSTAHLNPDNRDRFKILTDKEFIFDPYFLNNTATFAYGSASNQAKNVRIFRKTNIEALFNGTNGGTIADINTGALYMCTIGNLAAGASNDANFVLNTRVRFTDL